MIRTANGMPSRVITVENLPIGGGEVLASSELIQRMTDKGVSPANARQILSRSAGRHIWRSNKLNLGRGEKLFAQQAFRESPEFYAAAKNKLAATSRRGMTRCLEVLDRHKVLHVVDVMRLLAVESEGAGGRGGKQRRAIENELEALADLGVVRFYTGTALDCIVDPGSRRDANLNDLATEAAERLRIEAVIARITVRRLKQQGIMAWGGSETPDDTVPYVLFNRQLFTARGFSYLAPAIRWKAGGKKSPCPVVVDCHRGDCSKPQVEAFIERLERATYRKGVQGRILGVLAARSFEQDAWKLAKSMGIMVINLRQQFGAEAVRAMEALEKIVHQLVHGSRESACASFLTFDDIIRGLKHNPVVADLRAVGLEALAGLILSSCGYESVTLGMSVPHNTTTREVDVHATRADELRIIECKAYHGGKAVSADEVKKFFTETVPALKAWFRTQKRPFQSCVAEIWTTGGEGAEAKKALEALPRPRGGADKWGILGRCDLVNLAPSSVKDRADKLVKSIAFDESSRAE
jgi:hypothetical protein